jgi:hypothetical protein
MRVQFSSAHRCVLRIHGKLNLRQLASSITSRRLQNQLTQFCARHAAGMRPGNTRLAEPIERRRKEIPRSEKNPTRTATRGRRATH